MLADFDPSVTGIAAQPFLLTGADGSRIRHHVPDLLLAGADGGSRWSMSRRRPRMADPAVGAQFAWTRQLCAGQGWAFEAWSAANVRFLACYRREAFIAASLIPAVLAAAAGCRRAARSSGSCPEGIRRCWSGRLCCTCCGLAGC
jgi:hypothetical protein